MIASTHVQCVYCSNDLLCADQGECMEAKRRENRRLMDKLSTGERFMLMFGAGRYDRATGKVVPVEKTV